MSACFNIVALAMILHLLASPTRRVRHRSTMNDPAPAGVQFAAPVPSSPPIIACRRSRLKPPRARQPYGPRMTDTAKPHRRRIRYDPIALLAMVVTGIACAGSPTGCHVRCGGASGGGIAVREALDGFPKCPVTGTLFQTSKCGHLPWFRPSLRSVFSGPGRPLVV